MAQWFSYPMDSPGGGYQEIVDPLGNYLKPDTNIAVPYGTPITTWDSGVITSVVDRGRSLAGLSVTEKLDHPVNNQAQYASFNYLGSSTVAVGQRVNKGQQVGVAGSPYGINFALGLGTSPIWGQQCPQCHNIAPSLDPRIVLNQLRAGGIVIPASSTGAGAGGTSSGLAGLPFGIGGAISYLQQAFVNMAEEIGIFLLALMLIILGVILLAGKQIEGAAKRAGEAAVLL